MGVRVCVCPCINECACTCCGMCECIFLYVYLDCLNNHEHRKLIKLCNLQVIHLWHWESRIPPLDLDIFSLHSPLTATQWTDKVGDEYANTHSINKSVHMLLSYSRVYVLRLMPEAFTAEELLPQASLQKGGATARHPFSPWPANHSSLQAWLTD